MPDRSSLLKTLKAAADEARRHADTDTERLLDAMRAAEAAGAKRTQIAEASGIVPSGVTNRLGATRTNRRRGEPPPEPAAPQTPRPKKDPALVRRRLAAVGTAAETGRRRFAADRQHVDDAMRSAAAGCTHREIAEAAGVSPSAAGSRLGTGRRRVGPDDQRLLDAMRAADDAGVTRTAIAKAANKPLSTVTWILGHRRGRRRHP